MYRSLYLVGLAACVLLGCPEHSFVYPTCEETIVECSEARESYCEPRSDGDCENEACYYFVSELCWETCKKSTTTPDS